MSTEIRFQTKASKTEKYQLLTIIPFMLKIPPMTSRHQDVIPEENYFPAFFFCNDQSSGPTRFPVPGPFWSSVRSFRTFLFHTFPDASLHTFRNAPFLSVTTRHQKLM